MSDMNHPMQHFSRIIYRFQDKFSDKETLKGVKKE